MDRIGDYKVVGSFNCGNRNMVVVKAAHGTHVMPGDEWELIKKGLLIHSKEFCSKTDKFKVA